MELHLEPASIDVFHLEHAAGPPDNGTPRLAALPLEDQPHVPRRIYLEGSHWTGLSQTSPPLVDRRRQDLTQLSETEAKVLIIYL